MKKRIVSLIMATAMTAALLSGCGEAMNLVTEYGLRGCSWLSAKVDDHGLFLHIWVA